MQIAVIGPERCRNDEWKAAYTAGALIAQSRVTLVCAGPGGAMDAAAMGARGDGGLVMRIMHEKRVLDPIRALSVKAGLKPSLNRYAIQSSDAVIAIGSRYGMKYDIATALEMKRPVFGLNTPAMPGIFRCASIEQAVKMAIDKVTMDADANDRHSMQTERQS